MSKFCNIIGTILIVAVIVVCLVVTVPRLFGLSSYVVVSGSMTPAIPVNSLIYVKDCEPETLQKGDVIVGVNREKVESVEDLNRILSKSKGTQALNVIRGNMNMFIIIR